MSDGFMDSQWNMKLAGISCWIYSQRSSTSESPWERRVYGMVSKYWTVMPNATSQRSSALTTSCSVSSLQLPACLSGYALLFACEEECVVDRPLQIKIYFEHLPSFKPGDEDDLERKLWEKFADGGIIIAPGWFFMADDVNPPEPGAGHFRISFANAEVSLSTLATCCQVLTI